MKFLRFINILLVLLLISNWAEGQTDVLSSKQLKPRISTSIHTDTMKIHFKINEWGLLQNLGDNRKVLKELREYAPKEFQDHRFHYTFNSIEIAGGASPEGPYRWNQILSQRRTEAIRDYLIKHNKNVDPKYLSTRIIGIDWEKLYEQVLVDTVLANRKEVLDAVEKQDFPTLRRMNGGTTYRYLFSNKFAKLRSTWAIVKYDLTPIVDTLAKIAQYRAAMPAVQQTVPQKIYPLPKPEPIVEEIPQPSRWQIAVKTNALYDILITPNIGVELYLGKDWSLAGHWMYAWWKSDPDSWYHRIYGGDIEVRKWFGERNPDNPLTGWHAGVYANIVTYDFDWGGRGYLGDKWSWGFGVNAGYSKNIARRLNLDFTVSAGYLTGEYKEYLPIDDCYVWQVTKNRNWIGPTKAEISLVWLLGRW